MAEGARTAAGNGRYSDACGCVVLDMREPAVASQVEGLGICSVPAVVVDGKLAGCCAGRGPEESSLRAAGVGRAP